MKIKNLTAVDTFVGYDAVGFMLKAGEVSHELPAALLSNQYLRADVESGRMQVLVDERDKNLMSAMGVDLPVAGTPVQAKPKASSGPRDTVNVIEAELTSMLAKMKTDKDKRAYLENVANGFSPQAKAIAENLLKDIPGAAPVEPVKDVEKVPEKLSPRQESEKIAEMMTAKPVDISEEEPEALSQGEPQMGMGVSKEENVINQPTPPKSIHHMTKLELLKYAVELGCDVNPAMKHADIKAAVLKKRDGVK